MARRQPVTEQPEVQPEGSAPPESEVQAEPKPAKVKAPAKIETAFEKVTRRLARAKKAYEKLPESDDPDSSEYKAKAKAKAHLNGCVERYGKIANPQPEAEVADPTPA
jgi:hypothetical protein